MRHTFTLMSLAMLGASATAFAAGNTYPDSVAVTSHVLPAHSTVLYGNEHKLHTKVLDALLDTRDLHFQDPGVPRYLLIDKEGTTVLGIGGYVEGIATADFRGAIDNYSFITYDIPVPSDPAMRSRLGADVSHTTIFLKLVRNTGLGILNAYVQTNFTGDDGGYGLKLEQAYVSLGNVMLGLANSTFSDPSAGVPTIDYQGPSGQIGGKNILLRYHVDLTRNWTLALSAEMPKATITPLDDKQQSLNQSLPDVPVYLQYTWGYRSHVRASAIVRTLSYRDLVDGRNRHTTGYGFQLSGIYDIARVVDLYYQGAYGRGIAHYVNDLDGTGYDLVGSATNPGSMTAPRTVSVVAGAQYHINNQIFISGAYSFNRLYDQSQLSPDAYKRGNYVVANLFYTPIRDLSLGIEYLHGTRRNVNSESATANRIELMLKYSF